MIGLDMIETKINKLHIIWVYYTFLKSLRPSYLNQSLDDWFWVQFSQRLLTVQCGWKQILATEWLSHLLKSLLQRMNSNLFSRRAYLFNLRFKILELEYAKRNFKICLIPSPRLMHPPPVSMVELALVFVLFNGMFASPLFSFVTYRHTVALKLWSYLMHENLVLMWGCGSFTVEVWTYSTTLVSGAGLLKFWEVLFGQKAKRVREVHFSSACLSCSTALRRVL